MAILLDFEILFLLSNTSLYVSQRFPKPYTIVFAFLIIVVVLLHILASIVILLLSHVERTILSGNRLARLLRTIPVPKQTNVFRRHFFGWCSDPEKSYNDAFQPRICIRMATQTT